MSYTKVTVTTLEHQVAAFREANRRIRTMFKNGGSTRATTTAVARHQRAADEAMRVIIEIGERRLAGNLTEEASLINSIAASVTERPELQARLVSTRRDVRRRLAYLMES